MAKMDTQQWFWPDELEKLTGFLNDGIYRIIRLDDAVRDELRALIDEWMRAKSDWGRFLKGRLKLGKSVAFTHGTFYIPAQSSSPIAIPLGSPDCTEAEGIFQQFLLNPFHRQLAGPCRRDSCGRYFIQTTAHTKVYCSPRCASLDSAIETMKRKRKEIHKKLIAAALAAIARWKRKPLKGITWEAWVAGQVTAWAHNNAIGSREITARMIRGWAKRKEITSPVHSNLSTS